MTVHLAALCAALVSVASVVAQAADPADLAKQLANQIAALISVPIQANYDENFGPGEKGERWLTNVQPVIPITLGQK